MAFSDLGFKPIFSPTLRESVDAETSSLVFSELSDPRGLLRPGMVPSKNIQYKLVHGINAQAVSPPSILSGLGGGALGAGALASFTSFNLLGEVVLVKTRTQTATVFFEGRDVVDLPTEGLERDGDALIVPDRVFRPLFAGDELFVGPEDSLGQKATQAYGGFLRETNQIIGIDVSANAPPDTRHSQRSLGFQTVDTSSNRILVEGDPAFISYVAVDRPLFREVVHLRVTVQIIGSNGPISGFLATSSAITSSSATLLRYAFVDVSADGEDARFQWKLSESIGQQVAPEDGIQSTPVQLLSTFSSERFAKDALAVQNFHAVYDLNQVSDDGEDLSDEFDAKPLKAGVSPEFARAKLDSTSSFYDPNFRAVIQDYKLGFGSTGSLIIPEQSDVSGVGSGLTADANAITSYFSQNYELNLTNKGRMGTEYDLQVRNTVQFTPELTLVLAKTVEVSSGIAAVADEAIGTIVVYDIEDGQNTIVERLFDDSSWTQGSPVVPDSQLDQYLIGEIPLKSQGGTLFVPSLSSVDASSGTVEIPDESVAVSLSVETLGESGFDFRLFEEEDAESPLFEANFPYGTTNLNTEIAVTTPPLLFSVIEGSTVNSVAVAELGATLLEAFPDAGSETPLALQTSKVGEQEFPVQANNVHACLEKPSGMTVLAFENGERIDMGVRISPRAPATIIREVVQRIPDDFEGADEDDLPPASLPFLVSDPATATIFLFYTYKGRVLCKGVPSELLRFSNADPQSEDYSIQSELETSETIRAIRATVVYDGDGDNSSIGSDVDFGGIVEPEPLLGEESPEKPLQYSVCMDDSGHMFAFIQTENGMAVKKSSNLGDLWVDAVPRNFSFIPTSPTQPGEDQEFGEAPFCHVDSATNVLFLYFFLERSLLYVRVPAETLYGTPEEASSSLAELVPRLLVGPLTDDLVDRGISRKLLVEEEEEESEVSAPLNPHRIAVAVTSQGYLRLFYKDEDSVLRTILSIDSGVQWLTELQHSSIPS